MATITTRIPDELDKTLSNISSEIDRNKGYIVRKAIENYLETKGDILIALARIEREEEEISLEDIERKYDLAD
jgi:RHH-type rel operon transcriptional repressor/antitoxin RelB